MSDDKKPAPTDKPAAAAAPAPAKPEPGRQVGPRPQLFESNLALADFKEPRIVVDIPAGVAYEQLFDPKFWANVSPKLPPGAVLICRDEENSYRAELIVRNSGRGWAKLEELAKHVFKASSSAPGKADKHDVEFVNPNIGWRVFRLSDNTTIKAGFRDYEAAAGHLRDYERVLAA